MSQYIVCPRCEGNGREPGSGITYTMSDLDEWAGSDHDDRMETAKAWNAYGDRCSLCRGRNVITEERESEYLDSQEEGY